MQKRWKVLLPILLTVAGVLGTGWVVHHLRHPIVLTGVVTIRDKDKGKQLPIAAVEVTAAGGAADAPAESDASGLFVLHLRRWVRKGRPISLQFRHPNYQPLDLTENADNKLYVIQMVPVAPRPENTPSVAIGNVRVRYSMKGNRAINVGSAVRTFEVANAGNIPCNHQSPCSPDGKWKAALGSITLDAGPGNEFENTRVSCIAGPCPFTRVESDDFSHPSQTITTTARNWSDTATFIVEAEVIHWMQSDVDHQSYPVMFGSALDFTLPAGAEGISLEADVGGETIIFPLGPNLLLSWARCNATPSREETIYRCELKPGYRFQ
jgi:hypothetical protein